MFELTTRITNVRPYQGGARVSGAAEEEELRRKTRALATSRFGDYSIVSMKKLFQSYDGDGDGKINRDELKALLKDADVGTMFTRGYWVDGIFDKLDASPKDDQLTWEEYTAALTPAEKSAAEASAGAPPAAKPESPPPQPTAPGNDELAKISKGDAAERRRSTEKTASSDSKVKMALGGAAVVGGLYLLMR